MQPAALLDPEVNGHDLQKSVVSVAWSRAFPLSSSAEVRVHRLSLSAWTCSGDCASQPRPFLAQAVQPAVQRVFNRADERNRIGIPRGSSSLRGQNHFNIQAEFHQCSTTSKTGCWEAFHLTMLLRLHIIENRNNLPRIESQQSASERCRTRRPFKMSS